MAVSKSDTMAHKPPSISEAPRWLLPALLAVAGVAFVSAIDGDFVYDDTRQIVDNPLIQESGRVGEALTSDVWAFRAEEGKPGSNYWRPTFVVWMIFNYRLFGLNPPGWHVTNILLHVLVTGLVFVLLRRLRLHPYVAAAVTLVFAVHPVHVESVSWIAGSPDLLLGATLIGALMLIHSYAVSVGWWKWVLAVVLSLIGMGAKEVGIVVPGLVFALVLLFPVRETQEKKKPPERTPRLWKATLVSLPFIAASVGYFFARIAVLGSFRQEGDLQHGFTEALLTAPASSMFYLRQIILPAKLSPIYQLEPVFAGGLGVSNFWVPLVILLLAGAVAVWLARRGAVQTFGLVFAALLLLPAFNIAAFPLDHMVHDRYLYLPLLGVLMIVVPSVVEWLASPKTRTYTKAATLTLVGAVVLAAPLLARTHSYTEVWDNEVALWEHAVDEAPESAFALRQYGVILEEVGRTREAESVFNRSLASRATGPAVVGQADVLIRQGRLAEAERLLVLAVEQQPAYHPPYERLGLVYQQQGRLNDAEEIFREGRAVNPEVTCAFSTNLGVVLYLQGRRDEALETLQEGAARADREATPLCRQGLYHLSELHRERGELVEARAAYERFLSMSENLTDGRTQQMRRQAEQQLARLNN